MADKRQQLAAMLMGRTMPQGLLGSSPPTYAEQIAGLLGPTPRPNIEFEQAVKQTPWYSQFKQRYGEEPNLYAPEYNLEKAWTMGVRPTPDPYDGNFPHWPSRAPNGEMLKSPDHKTAWMEYFMQATGKNPNALGINDYETAKKYLGKDFVPAKPHGTK